MPAHVAAAERIAEDVLYPAADRIDAAPVVPRQYLDGLAGAGLYDLPSGSEGTRIVEALGGASLVTAFVWIQHHSPVGAIAAAGGSLAEEWLSPLRAGRVRAGIAYAALRRSGPPAAVATPLPDGSWELSGHAPWVTGWGRIDVVLAAGRHRDQMVWLLLDAEESAGMAAQPVRLAALDASATVRLDWSGLTVPPERIVGIEPYKDWMTRDAAGRATNGYLAVGVAARCARVLGSERLSGEVAAARLALDRSAPETVTSVRSSVSLLALRAAASVVASGGGRSVESGQTAARLMREATFLLVFGQTPEIRAAQLSELSGTGFEVARDWE